MGDKMKYEKPKLVNLNEHLMSSEGANCSNGSSAAGFCTNGNGTTTFSCGTGTNPATACQPTGISAGGGCNSGSYATSLCITGTSKV
jgi:hypothetical protein